MGRSNLALGVYALVCGASGAFALWLWGRIGVHPEPWFALPPSLSHLYSGTLGATIGIAVVLLSPVLERSFRPFRNLAAELAPIVRSIPASLTVPLALLSALGEELLFRGVLVPSIGVIASSVLFGLVHQIPGPARWTWALSAAVLGLCLAALFAGSGSLLGPIVAHAIINMVNLRALRRFEPAASARTPLGGVLGSLSDR